MKTLFYLLPFLLISCTCTPQNRFLKREFGQSAAIKTPPLEIVDSVAGAYLNYAGIYSTTVPIVILKLKNISGHELSGPIDFGYIFSSGGEELCNDHKFFQTGIEVPLAPNGVRQIYFKSNISYFHDSPNDMECSIYYQGRLWKTFKIDNSNVVSSHRI